MSLRRLRSLLPSLIAVLLVATIVFGAMPPPIAAPAVARVQESEKQRDVIVLLTRGTDPRAVARGVGARPTHLYDHVIDGFAATLPSQAIRGLKNHPAVMAVVPDHPVEAFAIASPGGERLAAAATHVPRKCTKIENKQRRHRCIKKARRHDRPPSPPPDEPPVAQPIQAIPTGVDRVDADVSSLAGIAQDGGAFAVDVAVLDTGIAAHPDLDVVGGVSCLGQSYADDNGHGTHAAGTIAALDNAIGVVGVAPGARLWSVKVLDARGDGSFSSVICGLDWVYANRATIDAVNLSLGGDGADGVCPGDDPLHNAVCRVVNEAGIPVVVAAGNEGKNAAGTVPATYEEVITVSAFADFNGLPGGGAAATCRSDVDDTFANFSNFGADVDIAAPGVCIRSTSLGHLYAELSGTSMAAPHVTGAVALHLAERPTATPEEVRDWLLKTTSRPQNTPEGFTGDPDTEDTDHERALYLGGT